MQRLTYREATERAQRDYLRALMRETGGVASAAARAAGMNRQHFYRALQRHGIAHAALKPQPAARRVTTPRNRGNAAWQALGAR